MSDNTKPSNGGGITNDQCREYAQLAREQATQKPWAASSLQQTAEEWDGYADLIDRGHL